MYYFYSKDDAVVDQGFQVDRSLIYNMNQTVLVLHNKT